MSAFITLGNAARRIAGEDATQEEIAMFAALLESEADNLHAGKTWVEHTEEVPGGISYWRAPEQWRIPRAVFAKWCGDNGYPVEAVDDGILIATDEVHAPDLDVPSQRERAILQAIQQRGWDPQSLPVGGVKALKGECMQNAKLFTDSVFDRAWKSLVAAKKARTAQHDRYSKRYK